MRSIPFWWEIFITAFNAAVISLTDLPTKHALKVVLGTTAIFILYDEIYRTVKLGEGSFLNLGKVFCNFIINVMDLVVALLFCFLVLVLVAGPTESMFGRIVVVSIALSPVVIVKWRWKGLPW
jgi:hypothetical protein